MALHIDGPSHKVGELVKEKQLINWEKEISESQARRLLQKKFYPFQEVLVISHHISGLSILCLPITYLCNFVLIILNYFLVLRSLLYFELFFISSFLTLF